MARLKVSKVNRRVVAEQLVKKGFVELDPLEPGVAPYSYEGLVAEQRARRLVYEAQRILHNESFKWVGSRTWRTDHNTVIGILVF